MKLLKKIFFVLNKRQITDSVRQLILMFISMIFEIASIGIVIPLIKIITDTEFQKNNKYFIILYKLLNKPKNEYILLYLLAILIFLYISKVFQYLNMYQSQRIKPILVYNSHKYV